MRLRLSGPKSLALFATTLGIGLVTIAPASAQVKFSENFKGTFTAGGYSGGDVSCPILWGDAGRSEPKPNTARAIRFVHPLLTSAQFVYSERRERLRPERRQH